MKNGNKSLWVGLALLNLCLVALFGFLLRSKIVFPLAIIDYRNLLSAHSHFAFSGWAGLSLLVLLVYNLLPETLSGKSFYQWVLAGVEISSLGMAALFPFVGYNSLSIFFSSLYIVMNYVFAPVFVKDVIRNVEDKTVRLFAVASIAALLLSAIGPLGLVYILLSNSGNSILYRDSIYTFLHFQYNGFFTLAVFALFFQFLHSKKISLSKKAQRFAIFLCLSVLPSLFLSLLWHGKALHYGIAIIGALLILLSLLQFILAFFQLSKQQIFSMPLGRMFWLFSVLSFLLKLILNAGTLIPSLGHAVYGDRPVIIGFLHLVFLGFVTFYILSYLIEEGRFSTAKKSNQVPFAIFAFGIIANELLLALQGLGILFKTNSGVYNWLLWIASIFLFVGASAIAWTFWKNKKRQAISKP